MTNKGEATIPLAWERKITLGPALVESLEEFPVLINFNIWSIPDPDDPFKNFEPRDPVPWKRVKFSFSSDPENEEKLSFTHGPGREELLTDEEFCACVTLPFLSCEEETTIWLSYGEDVEGRFVDPWEFWTALGYICSPEVRRELEISTEDKTNYADKRKV